MIFPALLAYGNAATEWYGPMTVRFALPIQGNPYDPVQNDIRVEFKGPNGRVERRLAYYDAGAWRATLVTTTPGRYVPTPIVNGKRRSNLAPITIAKSKAMGYVRLGGPHGFRLDNGAPYWPIGHNLAWANSDVPDLPTYIRQMGQDGLNWARIWANHWDDKNPFWPTKAPAPKPGEMSPAVLKQWDSIVAAADSAGVKFQLTLFHHGPWSSRVNSNWNENPWNAKNGGWLKTPSDFFTDPRAQALSRAWLRYAVARWGHSPSIMAWELFNEVEWCDPNYENRSEVIGTWHDAMVDYLRSLDPYRHLITTSSKLELPIYRKVDFLQPHGYPPSVEAMMAATAKTAKPLFYGEVGPGEFEGGAAIQRQSIRDGIYTGLLCLQAGSGQYWTWDNIPKMGLRNEFVRGARLIRESGAERTAGWQIRPVRLDAGFGGTLILKAGAGWETSRQFRFRLPEQADQLGKLSSYLQGKAHPEMQTEPVRFDVNAPKPVEISVEVISASDNGGNLSIEVDGREVATQSFAAKGKGVVKASIPAGAHTVALKNDGADWVQLGKMIFPGIAPRAAGRAIAKADRAFLRIQGEPGVSVTLDGLGLRDGTYQVKVADLDASDSIQRLVVKGGKTGRIQLKGRDSVLLVTALTR